MLIKTSKLFYYYAYFVINFITHTMHIFNIYIYIYIYIYICIYICITYLYALHVQLLK